jgi:hypothetical protein
MTTNTFIVVLGGSTLWHLQKFFLKYISTWALKKQTFL